MTDLRDNQAPACANCEHRTVTATWPLVYKTRWHCDLHTTVRENGLTPEVYWETHVCPDYEGPHADGLARVFGEED